MSISFIPVYAIVYACQYIFTIRNQTVRKFPTYSSLTVFFAVPCIAGGYNAGLIYVGHARTMDFITENWGEIDTVGTIFIGHVVEDDISINTHAVLCRAAIVLSRSALRPGYERRIR
jgi:hypothetical protein